MEHLLKDAEVAATARSSFSARNAGKTTLVEITLRPDQTYGRSLRCLRVRARGNAQRPPPEFPSSKTMA